MGQATVVSEGGPQVDGRSPARDRQVGRWRVVTGGDGRWRRMSFNIPVPEGDDENR